MRQITQSEMENLKTVVNCKDDYSKEQYQIAVSTLKKRREYLYPLITELAKLNIRLKDINSDLYYEYLNITIILEIDKSYN